MKPSDKPNPLPREIGPGVHWLGRCNVLLVEDGQELHSYNSAFLVVGTEHSAIVDTGMPGQRTFNEQLESLLAAPGVPPLRYAFVTHSEMAHVGGLGWVLDAYPDVTAHGEVADLHMVWPEFAARLEPADPGDAFDLGGTEIQVVESVFRDLMYSRWFFDLRSRVLFPADGFAVAHEHVDSACGRFVEDVPDLAVEDGLWEFANTAFFWTRLVDIEPLADRLGELILDELHAAVIAPAHGLPLRDPRGTVPRVVEGLRRMKRLAQEELIAHGEGLTTRRRRQVRR